MAVALPLLPQFDTERTNSGKRWNKYLKRFENLLETLDLKEDRRKKALLLNYSGRSVQDTFKTLTDHAKLNYAQTVKALTNYFEQKKDTSAKVRTLKNDTEKAHQNIEHFCPQPKRQKRNRPRSSPYFNSFDDANRKRSLPEQEDKTSDSNIPHSKRIPRKRR